MQRYLPPAGALVLLVLSACGAGHMPAPRATPVAERVPNAQALVVERRAAARREAERLVRTIPPPADAIVLRGTPHDYGPKSGASFGETVRVSRFWRSHASYSSLAAYIARHAPAGFTIHGPTHVRQSAEVLFDTPGRSLDFSIEQRPARTLVRVDAEVTWIYPRPPQERIPAGVRAIDFSTPKLVKHATNPAAIAKVVRWFDALPLVPPHEAFMCPVLGGLVPVMLDFRGAGGTLLAHVSAQVTEPRGSASVCNPIGVHIRGRLARRLTSNDFFARVQRLIGVTVKAPQR